MANEPTPAQIAEHLRKFTWGPVAFMAQAADAIDACVAEIERLRSEIKTLEMNLRHTD